MSRDIGDSSSALDLRPRPSAGVSSLVAPVALVGLDEVAREDLTGIEGDEGDVGLIDDGQDARSGSRSCADAYAARV